MGRGSFCHPFYLTLQFGQLFAYRDHMLCQIPVVSFQFLPQVFDFVKQLSFISRLVFSELFRELEQSLFHFVVFAGVSRVRRSIVTSHP